MSSVEFAESYGSPRELAIAFGLAQPGRGRLSLPAKALIAEAEKAGVVFTNIPAVFDPNEGPPAPAEQAEIQPHERDGVHYAKVAPKGHVRPPVTMYGRDADGHTIAFTNCYNCKQFSAHCECPSIALPPYVVALESSEPFTKEA